MSTPIAPVPKSHRRSRVWLGLFGGLVAVNLAVTAIAVICIGKVPIADIWSRRVTDRAIELAVWWTRPVLATSAMAAEPTIPRLIVQPSPARAMSGEPAPLGLALNGPAEGAVVIITGLLPGMTLSAGSAVGDAWQVPAPDIGHVWIGPPERFVGSPDIVAELRLSDDTIADRQAVRIEWVLSIATVPPIAPGPTARGTDGAEIATPPVPLPPAPHEPDLAETAPPQIASRQPDRAETAVPPIAPGPAPGEADRTEIASLPISPGAAAREPDGTETAAPPIAPGPAAREPDRAEVAGPPASPAPAPGQLDRAEIASLPISPGAAAREPERAETVAPPVPLPSAPREPERAEVTAQLTSPVPEPHRPDRDQIAAAPMPLARAQRQLDREEILVLLKRGKDLIANGDFSAARLVLQRAADANDVEAALALAATYDPFILKELKVYGFSGDAAMARIWYEKAKKLGSPEAGQRLEMLVSGAR